MRDPFALNNYTIGPMTTNRKVMYDFSIIKYWEALLMKSEIILFEPVQFYSLDVIISVGYRVKSKRGTEFRQWANSVLKQYIIEGYAINEKRLLALERTVDIQTKMLADNGCVGYEFSDFVAKGKLI